MLSHAREATQIAHWHGGVPLMAYLPPHPRLISFASRARRDMELSMRGMLV